MWPSESVNPLEGAIILQHNLLGHHGILIQCHNRQAYPGCWSVSCLILYSEKWSINRSLLTEVLNLVAAVH